MQRGVFLEKIFCELMFSNVLLAADDLRILHNYMYKTPLKNKNSCTNAHYFETNWYFQFELFCLSLDFTIYYLLTFLYLVNSIGIADWTDIETLDFTRKDKLKNDLNCSLSPKYPCLALLNCWIWTSLLCMVTKSLVKKGISWS